MPNQLSSKYDYFVYAFAAIVLVGCIAIHTNGHNWGDDFSLYLNQTKAINDHSIDQVMANNIYSIENSTLHTFSPILAPWGWPLMASPIYKFWKLDLNAYKIYISILYCFFLIAFFYLISKNLSKLTALIIIIFFGTSFQYLTYTNNILTEIPFLLFSTLTLLSIQNYHLATYKYWESFLLGFLIYYSFLIRSEGIMLGVGLFAFQIRDFLQSSGKAYNRRFYFWIAVPYLFIFLLYFAISLIFPSGFLSHFNDSSLINIGQITKTAIFYSSMIKLLINEQLSIIVFSIIGLFAFTGLLVRFIKDIHISIYLISVIIVYLVWPFNEFRYTLVFFPLIIYFMAHGINRVLNISFLRISLTQTFFILLVICNLFYLSLALRDRFLHPDAMEGPETVSAIQMFDFVKKHTRQTDVVVFFRPRAMTLFGQRRSIMVYDSWRTIVDKGDFLILHKSMQGFCQFDPSDATIDSDWFNKAFSRVYENDLFEIFKIKK